MTRSNWSDEQLETLRVMWPHHTSSQLGAHFGVTRNVIIGKAHRLGLKKGHPVAVPRPEKPVRAKPVARKKDPERFPTKLPKELIRIEPEAPSMDIVEPIEPAPIGGVTLLELDARACRWIVCEGDTETQRYCGALAKPLSSYCSSCHPRVWVPARQKYADGQKGVWG